MDIKAIIALALTGAALLVVIVSMATEHWADNEFASVGLWKVCSAGICASVTNAPDWWNGVQAAICLAFISNLGAAVTLALFALVSSIPEKITKLSSLVLLGLAVDICWLLKNVQLASEQNEPYHAAILLEEPNPSFWNFIAIVVFAAELSGSDLSWSWGIAILAIILEIVALVFTVLATREEA